MRDGVLRERLALSALIFVAVAALFAAQIDYANVAGELVPIGCVTVALAAAAVQVARRLRGKREPLVWSGAGLHGYLLYVVYVFLIRWIGFLAATPVFIAAVFFVTGERSPKSLAKGLIFGIALAALIHLLFVVVMGNLIPMGVFE